MGMYCLPLHLLTPPPKKREAPYLVGGTRGEVINSAPLGYSFLWPTDWQAGILSYLYLEVPGHSSVSAGERLGHIFDSEKTHICSLRAKPLSFGPSNSPFPQCRRLAMRELSALLGGWGI